MTLDGPLEILGVKKLGGPQGLPGFEVDPNTSIESTGPIRFSTSETVYSGSPVSSAENVSVSATVNLLGFEKTIKYEAFCYVVMQNFFCAFCEANCDYCVSWRDDCLHCGNRTDCRICPPPSICHPCFSPKGEGMFPPFIISGEGMLDYGAGQAVGQWEIFARDGQILAFSLCWFHGDLKKCLTFSLLEEPSTDCIVETEDIGDFDDFLHAFLDLGTCYQGSINGAEDTMDGFRIRANSPQSSLRISARSLNESPGRIRIYRESPIRGAEIVDTTFDSAQSEHSFDQNGDDFWVEVYGVGSSVEYEVSAET
ncbi:MAG: hypothetical protein KC964_28445, partial [Candidatus Omnitrophica bacterium]|nr:hypothetical protein [Candidatus Omnitrophota bacterium]